MDLKEMSTNQQVAYWLGQVCIAIGSGDVKSVICQMMFYYQQEAFQRGVKEGLRQAKEQACAE